MSAGFVYLWEYRVRPESVEAFEEVYGPEGAWVQLFRRHDGYLGTELLTDPRHPGRYLTIDSWRSREDHGGFRRRFAGELRALDARCERLTEMERWLGDFERAD